MTVIFGFHMSPHRDFNNYYLGYVKAFYRKYIRTLLSYARFLVVMPRTIAPCVRTVVRLMESLQALN